MLIVAAELRVCTVGQDPALDEFIYFQIFGVLDLQYIQVYVLNTIY